MGTDTNNNVGQGSEVDSDLTKGFAVTEGNDPAETDPILSKHLDIAIKAQDGEKPETESKKPEDKSEGDKPKADEGDKKDSKGGATDTTAQPKPDEKGEKKEEPARGPKDLILKGQGADGTDLVIKGGAERRFYEQAQVQRQRATVAEERATRIEKDLVAAQEQLRTIEATIKEVNGLPPATIANATRLYGDLQRDPSGTLKKLLAEAVSLGHSVEGISAGVDLAAQERMLERKLAELGVDKQNAEPTEQEILREAEQEVSKFYSQFPDARPHDALFSAVLRDHPDLSLEAAYFQLKTSFIERGYDWSRSLDDNVRDEIAAKQAASGQEKQPEEHGKKPLPAGGSGVNAEEKLDGVVMSENSDTGDIVKAAMREAGMNI